MKIVRVGHNRGVDQEVERVVIEVSGVKYTITETVDGKVNVLSHNNNISVFPWVANSISFK